MRPDTSPLNTNRLLDCTTTHTNIPTRSSLSNRPDYPQNLKRNTRNRPKVYYRLPNPLLQPHPRRPRPLPLNPAPPAPLPQTPSQPVRRQSCLHISASSHVSCDLLGLHYIHPPCCGRPSTSLRHQPLSRDYDDMHEQRRAPAPCRSYTNHL